MFIKLFLRYWNSSQNSENSVYDQVSRSPNFSGERQVTRLPQMASTFEARLL